MSISLPDLVTLPGWCPSQIVFYLSFIEQSAFLEGDLISSLVIRCALFSILVKGAVHVLFFNFLFGFYLCFGLFLKDDPSMCGALPPDLHHITPDTVMREITLLMEIIWDNSSLGVFAILICVSCFFRGMTCSSFP